ncbi:MAG: sigma-54-dependent transcriptional regulator, partial [Thermodesulfobacteriota bacterium]
MEPKISILLVDDDDTFREVLTGELASMGYGVVSASSGEEAKERLEREDFDVALMDIRMPGMGGIQALRMIKESSPGTEVIMLTGHATIDNAVESMKLGAFDYLTKPCTLDNLEAVVRKALERKQILQKNMALKQELARRERLEGFIGESREFKEVIELISKVASTDSSVLIQGESGAGKELVARAIHRASPRRDNPFIIIDCGSLQENLLESELFGHEKGAYTGAVGLKHGLFEVADSGTIFLDEIGEISPSLQVKLLRVLEMGEFRRVGGLKVIDVDVRVLAATNKTLHQLVERGKFREDLFYRLNIISILIPPLRDRRGDIPLLARHFAENHNITDKGKKLITDEAMELLSTYRWPGNVRELQNVIERAIILSEDEYIKPEDLPTNLKTQVDFLEI